MKVELIKTIDYRQDVWYHVEKDGQKVTGFTCDIVRARNWYDQTCKGATFVETRQVLDTYEA